MRNLRAGRRIVAQVISRMTTFRRNWICDRVAGLVRSDLEPQEIIQGCAPFSIGSGDANPNSATDLFGLASESVFPFLQCLDIRRSAVLRKERRIKIASREFRRNAA